MDGLAEMKTLTINDQTFEIVDEQARNELGEKVGTDELTASVNTALEQAKASGLFDGEDGITPTITVTNGTEPDGRGNMTIEVKYNFNGIVSTQSATVVDGRNGATPVKGVDYFTDDDKNEIVQMVLTELGGKPVFGYVDDNNNIIVQGSLAYGVYTVKYEMEDGSTIDIGDLILGGDVHYSVTKNLTNCVVNNSATQVSPGGSYSATITANSGYNLSSVTVTMGGADITSSAYSNGVITIGSVTGNVVITASAVKEAAKTYTITNNLTNCANSNSVTVVEEGSAYNATITANDGYELDSVSATMGGSAVTVTNGAINIASVTGNIVITATATVKNWITKSQNADGSLFVGTNGEAGYKPNTRLGTSDGGERTGATGIEVTGFIPVTVNDTLYFKGVTITTNTNETTCFYDSNHSHLGGAGTNSFFGTMDGSVKSVKISSINKEPVVSKGSQIAYVRIAASEINANSIITKNQPIE